MPKPAPSFGSLCAKAVFVAKKTAKDLNLPFTIKHAADIIDQLDEDRAKAIPAEAVQRPKRNAVSRSELFNALALAVNINPSEATRAIKATIAVAVADIESVTPGLTPDEIRRRADAYRRKHRDWPLTPTSLAKYWGEFGQATGLTYAAKEETPPDGWQEALKSIYQEDPATASYLISLGWSKLGKDMKAAINKRCPQ